MLRQQLLRLRDGSMHCMQKKCVQLHSMFASVKHTLATPRISSSGRTPTSQMNHQGMELLQRYNMYWWKGASLPNFRNPRSHGLQVSSLLHVFSQPTLPKVGRTSISSRRVVSICDQILELNKSAGKKNVWKSRPQGAHRWLKRGVRKRYLRWTTDIDLLHTRHQKES